MNNLFKVLTVVGFILALVFFYLWWTLKGDMKQLQEENEVLKTETEDLRKELDDLLERLDNIQIGTVTPVPAEEKKVPELTEVKPEKKQSKRIATKPAKKKEVTFDEKLSRNKAALTKTNFSKSAKSVNYQGLSFHSFSIDVRETDLTFYYQSQNSGRPYFNFNNLRQSLNAQSQELVFATNGGMFNQSWEPVGLYVENGKEIFPLNMGEGQGNFFMQPNGVFYVTRFKTAGIVRSSDYSRIQKYAYNATQSGPLLLIHGRINPQLEPTSESRHIRSGVGLIDQHKVVFAISNEPVNLYEFAALFRDYYGCSQALYLDGVISKMYAPDLNRTQEAGDFGVLIGLTQPK